MFFTNPIWLWALTGLSIPVAIHLLSRKEGKVIYIGSLRHLQETSTQQFKGIRLNELLLLALRCLLIILFVLLLSGLSFHKDKGVNAPWVLVEKGLESSNEVTSQLNKFESEGYEIRLLASGFPPVADSAKAAAPPLYKSLMEDLNTKDISEVLVFAKNTYSGFAGMRSSLPSNVKWIGVASQPTEFKLTSFQYGDSAVTRTGHTSSEETYFTTEISSNPGTTQPPLKINLISDKEHQFDEKVAEAALRAIEKYTHVDIEITHSTPEENKIKNPDWLIWLSNKTINLPCTTPIIKMQPRIEQNLFVQESDKNWIITKRLNEEIALTKTFTAHLASIIITTDDDITIKNDARMVPDSIAWSLETVSIGSNTLLTKSAEAFIIVLFLVVLVVERILAYHKNQ